MKKNVKGFTLVELVVVSTIMVIMLGAILRFIRPINHFYQTTFATADANDIGNGVMNYFESEMRYTTDVLVLHNYEGMPVVRGNYVYTDYANSVKASDTKFTDVIIIDNNNVRGSQVSGYNATATVSRRKGATGAILKAPISDITLASGSINGTIDPSKTRIAISEELYSDFKAEFDIGLNTDVNTKALFVDMALYKPELENGSYIFEKQSYHAKRDMMLVNINDKRLGSDADMIAESYDFSGPTADYSKFPRESTWPDIQGTTLNNGQKSFYDTSNRFTYIFYTKDVVTSAYTSGGASSYRKCSFVYNGHELASIKVGDGFHIKKSQVAGWFSNSVCNSYDDDTYRYYFQGIVCNESNASIDQYYDTLTVTSDLTFSPSFGNPDTLPAKLGTVYFYNTLDADADVYDPTSRVLLTQVTVRQDDPSMGITSEIKLPTMLGSKKYKFKEWYLCMPDGSGANNPKPVGPNYYTLWNWTGDIGAVAIYEERPQCSVTFAQADGTPISGYTYADLDEGWSKLGDVAAPPSNVVTVPNGMEFVGWYLDGNINSIPITDSEHTVDGDWVFKPVFKTGPVGQMWGKNYYACKVTVHFDQTLDEMTVGSQDCFVNSANSFGQVYGATVTNTSKDYTFYMYYPADNYQNSYAKVSAHTSNWAVKYGEAQVPASWCWGRDTLEVWIKDKIAVKTEPTSWDDLASQAAEESSSQAQQEQQQQEESSSQQQQQQEESSSQQQQEESSSQQQEESSSQQQEESSSQSSGGGGGSSYGAELPAGKDDRVTYVIDITAGSQYTTLFPEIYNFKVKVYDADNPSNSQEGVSHFSIDNTQNKRYIVEVYNSPGYSQNLSVILRTGAWATDGQKKIVDGQSCSTSDYGQVKYVKY